MSKIPILGMLPLEKASGNPVERLYDRDPRSPTAGALRTIRVSIQLSGAQKQGKSLLFTSTRAGEGKSTLAANLAQAFAESGE